MNSHTARQLFESGGILHVLDCPKEMEFGIDLYSWQIGSQFQGIKMIPPGLHFCYYSERDLLSKQLASRQGFFIEIKQPNDMLSVVRWSAKDNLFQREILTPEEYQTRWQQRYELDRVLGQYPLDTYRQWLALSDHLKSEFLGEILPLNRHVCSSNDTEPRLPKLPVDPEFALRFTEIPRKKTLISGTDLTQSKLDRTDELEKALEQRFQSHVDGILCELQFSFAIFFLGHVYEGFEQWKTLINFLCSCQKAFHHWPLIYIEFFQIIYFQLKYFAGDEHLFADINDEDNYLYKSLENLFANLTAWNEQQQMEEPNFEKLIERAEKMKTFLNETFQWKFEDEPDDEKPVVVE